MDLNKKGVVGITNQGDKVTFYFNTEKQAFDSYIEEIKKRCF